MIDSQAGRELLRSLPAAQGGAVASLQAGAMHPDVAPPRI